METVACGLLWSKKDIKALLDLTMTFGDLTTETKARSLLQSKEDLKALLAVLKFSHEKLKTIKKFDSF
jgi:hypothetical protein